MLQKFVRILLPLAVFVFLPLMGKSQLIGFSMAIDIPVNTTFTDKYLNDNYDNKANTGIFFTAVSSALIVNPGFTFGVLSHDFAANTENTTGLGEDVELGVSSTVAGLVLEMALIPFIHLQVGLMGGQLSLQCKGTSCEDYYGEKDLASGSLTGVMGKISFPVGTFFKLNLGYNSFTAGKLEVERGSSKEEIEATIGVATVGFTFGF